MKICPKCNAELEENANNCSKCGHEFFEEVNAVEEATEESANVTGTDSGEEISGKETSGEETSGEETSSEETGVEETSGEETIGEETSGEETSAEEISGEETSPVETESTIEADSAVETESTVEVDTEKAENMDEPIKSETPEPVETLKEKAKAVPTQTENTVIPKSVNTPATWIILAVSVALIGVFMFLTNYQDKSPLADKKSDNSPLLYYKLEENGNDEFRVTGRGMEKEAIFTRERLSDTGLPIVFSKTTGETAYIGKDNSLYRMKAGDLSGSTDNQEKHMVAQGAMQIISFSPEGKYVYFLDLEETLWVNDGKESKIVDQNPLIQTTETGWNVNPLDNGRVVYVRQENENAPIELVTKQVDQEDSLKIIGKTGAYSVIGDDPQSVIYFLEQPFENLGSVESDTSPETPENPETPETEAETMVEPDVTGTPSLDNTSSSITKSLSSGGATLSKMSTDAAAVEQEDAGEGEAVQLTEEELEMLMSSLEGQEQQQEPMRISAYFYDIATNKSSLISEDIAQVLWYNGKHKVLFMEIHPDSTNENGFYLNMGYFDGIKSVILQEEIGEDFFVSQENELVVYSVATGEKFQYYLQALTDEVLPQRVEIGSSAEDTYFSFGASQQRREIYQFNFGEKNEMKVIPVEEDGTLQEARLTLTDLDSVMYQQIDGNPLILKNMSEDRMFGDLYLVKADKDEILLGENVWLSSLSNITPEMIENGEIVLTVMDSREYEYGTRLVGKIVSYHNGNIRVIGENVGVTVENQQSTIIYRNPNLIYYWDAPVNGAAGKLYRFTGEGEAEHISGNVQLAY